MAACSNKNSRFAYSHLLKPKDSAVELNDANGLFATVSLQISSFHTCYYFVKSSRVIQLSMIFTCFSFAY